jgi:hypothetical protein
MQTLETYSTVIDCSACDQEVAPAIGASNYAPVRFNAMKHGVLSRHVVLPHEDRAEFDELLSALIVEHQPGGATELHLVEELAGILWRKRRVLMAEGASINRNLKALTNTEINSPVPAAMPFEQGISGKNTNLRLMMLASPERIAELQEETLLDLRTTWKAKAILRKGGRGAYEKSCRALTSESRNCWEEYVDEDIYEATAEGLAEFIRMTLEPILTQMEKEARYQPEIKAQTMGEGLQANRLVSLSRYETHLDRKFERTLAMLIKLKQLRGSAGK